MAKKSCSMKERLVAFVGPAGCGKSGVVNEVLKAFGCSAKVKTGVALDSPVLTTSPLAVSFMTPRDDLIVTVVDTPGHGYSENYDTLIQNLRLFRGSHICYTHVFICISCLSFSTAKADLQHLYGALKSTGITRQIHVVLTHANAQSPASQPNLLGTLTTMVNGIIQAPSKVMTIDLAHQPEKAASEIVALVSKDDRCNVM